MTTTTGPRTNWAGNITFEAPAGQAIEVDLEEIAEAYWFSRDELLAAIRAREIALPPPVSIARQIIEQWYGGPLPSTWSEPPRRQ